MALTLSADRHELTLWPLQRRSSWLLGDASGGQPLHLQCVKLYMRFTCGAILSPENTLMRFWSCCRLTLIVHDVSYRLAELSQLTHVKDNGSIFCLLRWDELHIYCYANQICRKVSICRSVCLSDCLSVSSVYSNWLTGEQHISWPAAHSECPFFISICLICFTECKIVLLH